VPDGPAPEPSPAAIWRQTVMPITSRRSPAPRPLALILLAGGILASAALASPTGPVSSGGDNRIDLKSGRDLANWPRPRHFDLRHLTLEVDIPTMNAPRFNGRATYTAAAIGSARRELTLDARSVDTLGNGLTISAVRVDGKPAAFTHANSKLAITLPKPGLPGVALTIVIDYVCDYPANGGNGLTWSAKGERENDPTDRSPQLHSQGQPESNRRWIPCHDFPNEKLTTELIVTVGKEFQVLSNGTLLSQTPVEGDRTRWRWLQDKPHPSYLIMMAIGTWQTHDFGAPEGDAASDRPGLPMRVYAPGWRFDATVEAFKDTPAMVAFFEAYFDEPYPWAKYDQVICRDFKWGGMENTSATVLYLQAAGGGPGSEDDLIAHELAHQWTGDLVTCKSWEHLWLNEGWASYAEALWAEYAPVLRMRRASGKAPIPRPDNVLASALTGEERQAARRGYQRKMFQFLGPQRALNRGTAPDAPAMASNRYSDPEQPFTKGDDVYGKGALVLHMLRARLGDEVFNRAMRVYIDRFKFGNAETDDFRRVLEEVSGQSLERFFDQWVRRPGLPRVEVDLKWDDAAGSLVVTADQTQTVNADNPAYALVIPLFVKFADGSWRYEYLDTDVVSRTRSFNLGQKPESVSVDPNMTIAASFRTRTPLAMLWRQIIDPPTTFAQLRATVELRDRVLAAGAEYFAVPPVATASR
jgi:aminopeptidase N